MGKKKNQKPGGLELATGSGLWGRRVSGRRGRSCEGDNSGEGKETVEPAEEANQKRGGRLLLKKRWV
jgi:hypothetical protein